MNNLFTRLLLLVLLFALTMDVKAQKVMTEGVLTYEISSEYNKVHEMMKETKFILSFDDNMQAFKMLMFQGRLITTTITDTNKPEHIIQLLDQIGKKTKTITSESKMHQKLKNAELVIDKADTKEILGYKCHRESLVTKDDTVYFYVTNELSIAGDYFEKSYWGKLSGVALEFSMMNESVEIVLKATSIEETVPADAFTIPDGY